MSQALEAINKIGRHTDCSLDDLLNRLCHLGEPTISKMRNGWWCRVRMHVTAKGTEFQIESDTNCVTPLGAAQQCTERAIATLKQWS